MAFEDGSPERAQMALKIIYQLVQDRRRHKKKLNDDDTLTIQMWCASGMGILNQILNTRESQIAHHEMWKRGRKILDIKEHKP